MGNVKVFSMDSKSGVLKGGYTLVETLIFLAVSTVLFISAVRMVSGQQARAEFSYGIQEFATQIKDITNDVSTGFYHNPNNIICNLLASGEPHFHWESAGGGTQGENKDCIFIGRVIQFVPGGTPRPEETHRIFSVAGRRQITSGSTRRDVVSLSESLTVPIASNFCNIPVSCASAVPPLTEVRKFPNGMRVRWARVNNNPAQSVGSVGFFSNFVRYKPPVSGEDSLLSESESRTVNVVPINGTGFNESEVTAAGLIRSNTASSPMNPAGGVWVCIESGSGGYFATLNLGGSLRLLGSDLNIQRGVCP